MKALAIAGTPFLIAYRPLRGEVQVLDVLRGARQWAENF
jgi:hypothetical protein